MKKSKSKKGLTLLETLLTCLILGFLMLATVGMLSSGMNAEINIVQDIKTKQVKLNSNERISSKAREAASAYYSNNIIVIKIKGSNVYIIPETQALVVLVPKFDTAGSVIKPSANVTSFQGLAFSIVPKNTWDSTCKGPYVLLETTMDVDLTTTPLDPLKITQALPVNWSTNTTNLLADSLAPAITTTLSKTAFDVEGDIVNFSLTPAERVIYFPSPNGVKTINDSQDLSSFQLRNFRI